MSEVSKKDICLDVIRLILSSRLIASRGVFLAPALPRRYDGGESLDEITQYGPPCEVCAMGALFYAQIRGTPLNKLSGRGGESAYAHDITDSNLLPTSSALLARMHPGDRPAPYNIPFTHQELALFEKAFEGDGSTLTRVIDHEIRMQALSWHEAIWGAVDTEDNNYPERDLMLQLMANAAEHDGVPDLSDTHIRTEDELKKLAGLSAEASERPTRGAS